MRVQFYATLRAIVGQKTVEFPIAAGSTVIEVARQIVDAYPELDEIVFDKNGGLARSVHFMLNGRNVRWLPELAATKIQSDDAIDLFPPAAGG